MTVTFRITYVRVVVLLNLAAAISNLVVEGNAYLLAANAFIAGAYLAHWSKP